MSSKNIVSMDQEYYRCKEIETSYRSYPKKCLCTSCREPKHRNFPAIRRTRGGQPMIGQKTSDSFKKILANIISCYPMTPLIFYLPFPFAAPTMQDSLAGDDTVPASQGKHAPAPAGVYVPKGQGMQTPPTRETLPAGHGRHKANIPWNPAGHAGRAGNAGRAGSAGNAGSAGRSIGRSTGSGTGNCACMTCTKIKLIKAKMKRNWAILSV